MIGELDEALVRRLQAASYALPVVEMLQDIADDVAGWTADGLADKEIDRRIVAWMNANECGFESWRTAFEDEGFTQVWPNLDVRTLWDIYGVEQWVIDCTRSIAFTDEPVPFFGFTAGFMIEHPEQDPPMLIAIMTPMTDLDLAAKQIRKKGREFFGAKAVKRVKRDEVEAAKMLYLHRQGMSYREIAIQNLRSRHPDILQHEIRYRREIATEKSRVAKRIASAQLTWNERVGESSTAE